MPDASLPLGKLVAALGLSKMPHHVGYKPFWEKKRGIPGILQKEGYSPQILFIHVSLSPPSPRPLTHK